ncbi:L-seryl-tRNA(Sec) selenium transferase [Piscibacillus salipiscarius]|uniref:L-seryl-tRNA(Sec) selenium transferase n=1 Tax=Piscibacillus salipiscarius TaxID=299480 RepID=UPI0006D08E04|nr:L-seryl-tRNA(Sec) selenium transferase [Piscibacillus salipiscarius]
MKNLFRLIPSIHDILHSDEMQKLKQEQGLPETFLKRRVNQVVDDIREELLKNELSFESKNEALIVIQNRVVHNIKKYLSDRIEPVINGTGTILHTNLGRARLSEKAIHQVVQVAKHYSTLEFDRDSGERGSRHDLVEELIKELTGAEAAIVVNNNAASVYMVLTAFAKNHEVIVSRGELVEIGGSFRVSSIMEESGALLKEVGTTNKTHLFDYEKAINDQTSLMMKVHTSNFHMVGFTDQVTREDLVELGKDHHVMTYEDLGSGMVYDLTRHGIGKEPLVMDVLKSGIDLVSFSGDKLFGGPQVGIIAGKKQYIKQLKKHQLARVLRVDKMTYAALESTLKQWLQQDLNIPTIRDLLITREELQKRVKLFIRRYYECHHKGLTLKEIPLKSMVGGGTLPEIELDSYGVSITSRHLSATKLKSKLRNLKPRIIARVEQEQVLLDFRTITPEEEVIILKKIG